MHTSHLAGQITHSDREAEQLNLGQASFYKSAHTRGSKDVQGARCEPKGRVVLIVLATGRIPDCAALGEPAKYGPKLYQR